MRRALKRRGLGVTFILGAVAALAMATPSLASAASTPGLAPPRFRVGIGRRVCGFALQCLGAGP
jgi:hypothetical protein